MSESLTIKKVEHWRIDAFELWWWRRPLRDLAPRRSNQSILRKSVLNIHWKGWCWSWNSNTLATWCEELTHLKRPWCWERLKAGEGDDRGCDGRMASLTQWTWVWVNSRSWWWTGRPVCCSPWGHKSWMWLSIWTELNWRNLLRFTKSSSVYLGFPGGTSGKEKNPPANVGDTRFRFDPWVGKILWRRSQQPTSVSLPEESHVQRSLVGYSPWGHKELGMTKMTEHACTSVYSPPKVAPLKQLFRL